MRVRYRSAAQRFRAQEAKAEAEREAGIHDREDEDFRRPCMLDLSGAGGPRLVLEPRRGYVAWRARNADTGELVDCAAIKTLLHRVADDMGRMMSPRSMG